MFSFQLKKMKIKTIVDEPKLKKNENLFKLTFIKEVKLDEDAALDSTEFVVMELKFCIDDDCCSSFCWRSDFDKLS